MDESPMHQQPGIVEHFSSKIDPAYRDLEGNSIGFYFQYPSMWAPLRKQQAALLYHPQMSHIPMVSSRCEL